RKLAAASGCGVTIDAAAVPHSPAAAAAIAADPALRVTALTGGDDYELAFAAPQDAAPAIFAAADASGVPVSRIGMLDAEPGFRLRGVDGTLMILEREGWDHGAAGFTGGSSSDR
ncbi:MAG: hypothetical protein AAF684_09620, partial [Pseudomonadota bacterium]